MRSSRLSGLAILTVALAVAAAGCRTADGARPTGPPGEQAIVAPLTAPPLTTTSPGVVSPPEATGVSTMMWRVNPATLERQGGPLELSGHASLPLALPGRLLLFQADNGTRALIVADGVTLEAEAYAYPPGWNGEVQTIGFRSSDERVLVVHGGERPTLAEFSPETGVYRDLFAFEWAWYAQLLDGGERIALYDIEGSRDGPAPVVTILDTRTGDLLLEFELEGVEHGNVAIPPERASDPDHPYALVEPGIAWDAARDRLWAVHADGAGVTVAHLRTGEVRVERFDGSPSLWASALAWLVPPAHAKGAANEARRDAWLSGDGTRLISVGVQEDYLRDPNSGELTIITRPLGTLVIDTTSLELVDRLDLGVSTGQASPDGSRWVLTGTDSRTVVCDDACEGGPAGLLEDTTAHTGLYVLDSATLEIISHRDPGTDFYSLGFHGHQLITERFGPDGDWYESIDVRTGVTTGRFPFGESWFVANEAGVFELQLFEGT